MTPQRLLRVVILSCAIAIMAMPVFADDRAPVFRVFLKDGTALASWGEYAKVGDHLVLTIAVGQGAKATYEFVSLPLAKIDLPKTEAYAEAVRAAQFAGSRGQTEYTALSDKLAGKLASIAGMPDPKARLATAEAARQELLDWAATSHGYKATEVQQLLQLFDSAIVDLRVAAGESRFAINLSTDSVPPEPPKLRPAPTANESVLLALKAANATDSADVRQTLLARANAAAKTLGPGGAKIRAWAAELIATDARTRTAYRALTANVTRAAARAADRGDVMAITRLRQTALQADRKLGSRRAEDINALMTALDSFRDRAGERKLTLDHAEAEAYPLAAYRKAVAGLTRQLQAMRPALAAIRDLIGAPMTTLVTLERQTTAMQATFAALAPPAASGVTHALLQRAIEKSDAALRARHRAVAQSDFTIAREASTAAGEAITRIDQLAAALAGKPRAAGTRAKAAPPQPARIKGAR